MSRSSYFAKGLTGNKGLRSRSRHEKRLTKNRPLYILVRKGHGKDAEMVFVANKGIFNDYAVKFPVGTFKLRKQKEAYPFTPQEIDQIHERAKLAGKIVIHGQ